MWTPSLTDRWCNFINQSGTDFSIHIAGPAFHYQPKLSICLGFFSIAASDKQFRWGHVKTINTTVSNQQDVLQYTNITVMSLLCLISLSSSFIAEARNNITAKGTSEINNVCRGALDEN